MEDKVVANDGQLHTVLFVDGNGNEFMRQPCEIWSRAVGYLRPVKDYNPGKKAEVADRVGFKIDNSKL